MFYSTKEFCSICNVGRETLRLYEKMGLLHPHINPDNQYRCYDARDGSIVAEIKRYQAIGYSLKEIQTILTQHELPQIIASMGHMISIFHDKILYYQMLQTKTKEELQALQLIPEMLGKITEIELPGFVYIPDKILFHESPVETHNTAIQHMDFFVPCICIGENYHGNEKTRDFSGWGLIGKTEYAEYLNFHDVKSFPAIKAPCTIVDAGEFGTINKAFFDTIAMPFHEMLERNDLTLFAALLTRTHDHHGKYHRYLFVFCLPDQIT